MFEIIDLHTVKAYTLRGNTMKQLTFFILILINNISASTSNQMNDVSHYKLNKHIMLKDQLNNLQLDKQVNGIGRYYVGADGACDFSTIQAAINATIGDMNAPEVLIASNKTYEENLAILDINMFMDGSYSTCLDARNNIHNGGRSIIKGPSGSALPIIRVQGNTGSSFRYNVTIKNIQLQDSSKGGVRVLSSSAGISLENVFFFQLGNNALRVQGVTSASTSVTVKDSIFLLNSAINGGAIRCAGLGNIIVLDNSGLSTNSATGNGGGVYLEQACDLSAFDSDFANNTTDGNGGAIYAEFGSDIILERSFFNGNTAVSNGGAIYAIDGATTINAEAVKFRNNRSTNGAGGAVAVHNGASFTIKRTVTECVNDDRCNFFDGNEAQNLAGAIYNDNSIIDVSSTYFEENRAAFGTAIYVIGANSTTKIEGSIFNHNGNNGANGFTDFYVVRTIQQSDIDISYSTFADNNAERATFGVSFNSQLNISASIIYDISSGDVVDREETGVFNKHCIMVNARTGFEDDGDYFIINNPKFIDPDNRNYHLNIVLSPAIDMCNNGQAPAVFKDIDFQDRGFDDVLINPSNIFGTGPFDMGADESQGNLIFKDSFE